MLCFNTVLEGFFPSENSCLLLLKTTVRVNPNGEVVFGQIIPELKLTIKFCKAERRVQMQLVGRSVHHYEQHLSHCVYIAYIVVPL